MAYRCYMLDNEGKINRAEVVDCATDAAALAEAERRLAAVGCPAIEVWERERLVGLVSHGPEMMGQDRLVHENG